MNKLLFVTAQYPYGSGETFIENEINYLSKAFDEVYIYAVKVNASLNLTMRSVPQNVSVLMSDYKVVFGTSYSKNLLKPHVLKEIASYCLGKRFLKKIAACCFFDREVRNSTISVKDFLNVCNISVSDEIVVYSYWLSVIGMVAIHIRDELLKEGIKARIVSRCHRFDLYEDRAYLNYLPFQEYMINSIDKIFPCSIQGSYYLKERYPKNAKKISCSYLGVQDRFLGRFPTIEKIHIISCSNVIPVKRVKMIAKALSRITEVQIKWTHFGDGDLMDDLKAEIANLPQNITVELPGRVPNSEIYQYYNDNNVNLFINVSESEGLPVSIMEAISFGIPVIATDVGGTCEIVLDGVNGRLLPETFEINELAEEIREIISLSDAEYETLSHNARRIYEDKFSAEKNYTDFCKELLS